MPGFNAKSFCDLVVIFLESPLIFSLILTVLENTDQAFCRIPFNSGLDLFMHFGRHIRGDMSSLYCITWWFSPILEIVTVFHNKVSIFPQYLIGDLWEIPWYYVISSKSTKIYPLVLACCNHFLTPLFLLCFLFGILL